MTTTGLPSWMWKKRERQVWTNQLTDFVSWLAHGDCKKQRRPLELFKEWRRSSRPRLVAQTDSLAEVRTVAGYDRCFIASGREQGHAASEEGKLLASIMNVCASGWNTHAKYNSSPKWWIVKNNKSNIFLVLSPTLDWYKIAYSLMSMQDEILLITNFAISDGA